MQSGLVLLICVNQSTLQKLAAASLHALWRNGSPKMSQSVCGGLQVAKPLQLSLFCV